MTSSCEVVGKRILDQTKFTYLSSISTVSKLASLDGAYKIKDDHFFNSYCCNLCRKFPTCVAFNNWRKNDTCNFYTSNIHVSSLILATIPSSFNISAGLRLSENF